MKLLVLALIGFVVVQGAVVPAKLEGQSLVDHINTNARTWKADLQENTHEFKSRIMDRKYLDIPHDEIIEKAPNVTIDDAIIPASFDARRAWPRCLTIRSVTDQSNCGSCWAVSTAATISDRICIANAGARNDRISADDILSCAQGNGCDGGHPYRAFQYYVHKGVVTGSSYIDSQGCLPYPFPPCGSRNGTYNHRCPKEFRTPTCATKCQSSYPISYLRDKHYGKSVYMMQRSVAAIQMEIMTNGPVVVGFTVYEDFYYYKSGIYQHIKGAADGGHAMKIIGWGSENGIPYWILANSWGTGWGEGGFVRMIRGINDCGIEDTVVAGLPE